MASKHVKALREAAGRIEEEWLDDGGCNAAADHLERTEKALRVAMREINRCDCDGCKEIQGRIKAILKGKK